MTSTTMYRTSRFRELCAMCDRFARAACARCVRPLCGKHEHAELRRCSVCEKEFALQTRSRLLPTRESAEAGHVLIGAVCVWALALLISPAFAVVIGLPTFVAAGLIAADLAGASPRIEKRRRFLNERKQ